MSQGTSPSLPSWAEISKGLLLCCPFPAEGIPWRCSFTRFELQQNHNFLPPHPISILHPLTRKLLQPSPLWAPILSILPPKQLDLRRLRGAVSSVLSLLFRRADLSEDSQGPRPRAPPSLWAGLTSPIQGGTSERGLRGAPVSSFCSLSTWEGTASSSKGILSSKWSSKFFTKGKKGKGEVSLPGTMSQPPHPRPCHFPGPTLKSIRSALDTEPYTGFAPVCLGS